MFLKILFIADIIGEPGRDIVKKTIPELKQEYGIEFIIANGENLAGGKGITKSVAEELFSAGVNAFTLGNHTWERKEIDGIINDERVMRPANYPQNVPGKGFNIFTVSGNIKIAVVSLMGRVYMPLSDCPFHAAESIISQIKSQANIIFVDFHAEITSEKQAMGWHLDSKVSAMLGTHTHVQTADERILPGGTAYITDCGMCGVQDSVIGVDKEIIIKRYLTGIPYRFNVPSGKSIFNGCVIEIDTVTGKSNSITRVFKVG